MARHLVPCSIFLILLGNIIACDAKHDDFADAATSIQQSVEKSVNDVVGKAKTAIDDLRPHERAQSEFAKLYDFEYHVESIPLPTTAQDLQLRLNDLGAEKWECDRPVAGLTDLVQPSEDPRALIICKRRPDSYLRMLKQVTP